MRGWPAKRKALRRSLIGLASTVLVVALGVSEMTRMPLSSHRGPLPPLEVGQAEAAERLRHTVDRLTESAGTRNVIEWKGLRRAQALLELEMAEAGLTIQRQPFSVYGREVANLEVQIPGTDRVQEVIVIGAHYDSISGTVGADDNASGVAAVVELARRFATRASGRSLRFVFFVNEEPPYFQTDAMGSVVHARALTAAEEGVVAMISIETIGYYDERKGSQHYPSPFHLFYPDRGDFIAFVGNLDSRRLLRRSVELFRQSVDFPSEGVAGPERTPGISWSDHWAYWQVGVPALMVTDTAPFRNPNYHRASDTADTLDYERMARVVDGLEGVIRGLGSDPALPR